MARFTALSTIVREHLDDPAYRRAYFTRRFILEAAATVRDLREAAGLTQAELAERAGLTQSAVARLESAKDKRAPRVETLARIAEALGKRISISLPPRKNAPLVTSSHHAAL